MSRVSVDPFSLTSLSAFIVIRTAVRLQVTLVPMVGMG